MYKNYALVVLLALSIGWPALGQVPVADAQVPAATQDLLGQYPGLLVHMDGPRVLAIYGKPMTAARSPEDAAKRWLEDHAAALGVENLELQLQHQTEIGLERRFTVFAFRQFIDGVPVEHGIARLLVLNGPPDCVTYVGAKLAPFPKGGFLPDTIDGPSALAKVRALQDYAHLSEWSQPELVIFYGDGAHGPGPSVRAWKFLGVRPALEEYEAYRFFVDAASGDLVHVRDEVYHVDIVGHVSGVGTPGTLPDVNYNLPVQIDLADLRVRIQGGAEAFSDRNGDFTIPNPGSSPVTVEADLIGRWVEVHNAAGAELHLEELVTPPGPVNFIFNPTPAEFTTAQVNGFIGTTAVHNFFKDRQPGYTGLDIVITCNVNIDDVCNAFYSGNTINFFWAGDGCVNTAYSTVISHEYGHFIVQQLFLAQGAFGEGYGDSIAILQYDDPIIARDFRGPGNHIRDIVAANVQYPCSGGIHYCGMVLAGAWWDIKLEMEATWGSGWGLEQTRQLFTDWSLVTTGGDGDDSAHPQTVIEVLTVDDDDGDITNGTPNVCEICTGFDAHSVPFPSFLDCDSNGIVDRCEIDLSAIYVDGSYTGCENGSRPYPFDTVIEGVRTVWSGGQVTIEAGYYPENMTIEKALTLRAENGTVVIGE